VIPFAVHQQTLLTFLKPIAPYLDDPRVSEILVNGPSEIFIERQGKLIRTDTGFSSQEKLLSALTNLAQYVGRPLDLEHPILEGRLPDGSRVEAILPPIAPLGPMVAIRRFSTDTLTMDRLIQMGSLTSEAVEVLSTRIVRKNNIIVSGGTGSGKTSMLNALSSRIPRDDRVVVIEDSRELRLQREHVVQLEARPADSRGRGRITIRDLFKATLRLRPDRIVIGEIRGAEALDLVQAMTSGHSGCLSTLHATYPIDTLNRLETMALMSDVQLPLTALRMQIASAINIIVQVNRFPDGSRGVTHVTQVSGCDTSGAYQLEDLFVRNTFGINSTLVSTGQTPPFLDENQPVDRDII
jgi:pilus assembly protein CpaF